MRSRGGLGHFTHCGLCVQMQGCSCIGQHLYIGCMLVFRTACHTIVIQSDQIGAVQLLRGKATGVLTELRPRVAGPGGCHLQRGPAARPPIQGAHREPCRGARACGRAASVHSCGRGACACSRGAPCPAPSYVPCAPAAPPARLPAHITHGAVFTADRSLGGRRRLLARAPAPAPGAAAGPDLAAAALGLAAAAPGAGPHRTRSSQAVVVPGKSVKATIQEEKAVGKAQVEAWGKVRALP